MIVGAMPRYIFSAGRIVLRAGGSEYRTELWLGIESETKIDVAEFSREHGYDLVPADGLRDDELRSVGVRTFARWP